MKRTADRRLRLVLALSLAAFAVVVIRAAQIQVVDAAALSHKAVSQQRDVVVLPGLRGAILSANGQHLAQEQSSKTIVVNTKELRRPHQTAVLVARALGYHELKKRHHPKHRKKQKYRPNPEWPGHVQAVEDELKQGGGPILRQLQPEVAARIMSKHLPGLSTITELTRWYPFHGLAPQIIGYTQVNGPGEPAGPGVAGIEQQYNRVLSGKPGRQVVVHDPIGQALDTVRLKRPVPGRDITLTLDTTIQARVEAVLAQTVRSSGAKWATGIVLDPRTGAILAMANAPGYDNNKVHGLTDFSPTGPTQNAALMTTYEPGSTYKVVTFSAALSAGLIYPHMVFHNLPWKIRVGDKFIHDDVYRKPVSYDATQILQKSSNVGTDTIAQIVGKARLMQWIRRYGFGRPTGLDFPGESQGIVLPGRKWTASSIGTIPIGQGIGVTAMQMTSMYQAIANGGVMVPPRLVQAIGGRPIPPHKGRRVLAPDVDRELVDMLGTVVQDGGTGFKASICGYSVAGKTGTAQKPIGGGYSQTDYDASFVGFFPAHAPEVEVMIVVDSPRTSHFGGVVAAPAFEQIGTWLANYLGIRPDKPCDRSVN
ncbi:MAG TPA: penicillin-binding protein 2 [Gaiellales bacterium]|nr:penicillin-binding protein 2 [Gaiellales bacterium]